MNFSSGLNSLEALASRNNSVKRQCRNENNEKKPNENKQHGNKRHDRRHRLSWDEELIRKRLVNLEQYNPQAPSTLKESESETCVENGRMHHLVLLFLIIDDLPYEQIWRTWMEDSCISDDNRNDAATDGTGSSKIDTNGKQHLEKKLKISVLCHAKFPHKVKSPWLQKRLLRRGQNYHSYRPEWGSIEITRAMIDLLIDGFNLNCNSNHQNRYKDEESKSFVPSPDRFLFLSESCLPIQSLNYFYDSIYNSTPYAGKSWINARNTPNNGYSRQKQFDRVSQVIPKHKIWKADQWMLLTRKHAEAIVIKNIPYAMRSNEDRKRNGYDNRHNRYEKNVELWSLFKHVSASDEIYFPTACALLGIIPTQKSEDMSHEKVNEMTHLGCEVVKKRVTYCDWSGGDRNPVTFRGMRSFREVAIEGEKEGCLVARKFDSNSNSNDKSTTKMKRVDPITVKEWCNVVLKND